MKRIRTLAIGIAIAFAISTPSIALAAPVADQTQTISGDGSTTTTCIDMGGIWAQARGSQFTPGVSGSLSKLDIQVISTFGDRPLTFAIWNAVAGIPSGEVLASQDVSVADLASVSNGGTLSVNFSEPASLTKGSQYVFTMTFKECAGTSLNLMFPWNTTTQGQENVVASDFDGNWSETVGMGMNFTTYFEDQSTTGGGDVEKPTPTETPTLANTGVNSFEYTQSLVSVSVILIFAGLLLLLKKRVTK